MRFGNDEEKGKIVFKKSYPRAILVAILVAVIWGAVLYFLANIFMFVDYGTTLAISMFILALFSQMQKKRGGLALECIVSTVLIGVFLPLSGVAFTFVSGVHIGSISFFIGMFVMSWFWATEGIYADMPTGDGDDIAD